jgi:lysophospholipase L1-like esterase
VFAHKPDLVIWQMGGNDVTWGRSGESLEAKIAEGVKALRARGADVILMDQQYTPVILATSYAKMQAAISSEARQDKVALLPRFEMLHKTVDAGISIGALSAFDGLHMSGEAYDCVGRALARAIAAAVK